ncbi:hypothetical protein N9600_02010 [Flavobacteriaceae bacterium]|nr:hypothetical protein [Flavobacteriaceae bacterium]
MNKQKLFKYINDRKGFVTFLILFVIPLIKLLLHYILFSSTYKLNRGGRYINRQLDFSGHFNQLFDEKLILFIPSIIIVILIIWNFSQKIDNIIHSIKSVSKQKNTINNEKKVEKSKEKIQQKKKSKFDIEEDVTLKNTPHNYKSRPRDKVNSSLKKEYDPNHWKSIKLAVSHFKDIKANSKSSKEVNENKKMLQFVLTEMIKNQPTRFTPRILEALLKWVESQIDEKELDEICLKELQ